MTRGWMVQASRLRWLVAVAVVVAGLARLAWGDAAPETAGTVDVILVCAVMPLGVWSLIDWIRSDDCPDPVVIVVAGAAAALAWFGGWPWGAAGVLTGGLLGYALRRRSDRAP